MPGQVGQLRDILARARRAQPGRALDLVFLTVGANDIYFAGLVADVIIDATAERVLARRSGVIATVEEAQSALDRTLPAEQRAVKSAGKILFTNTGDWRVETFKLPDAIFGNGQPGGSDFRLSSDRRGLSIRMVMLLPR